MKNLNQPSLEIDALEPAMSIQSVILMLMASVMGALIAAIILPAWLPGLSASILGESPKLFWYLSRASAFVSFALLWMSMALGLIITNKMARLWPGGPVAFDLHQYTSLLGLGFAIFHGLILLGDQFIGYSLAQILIPFSSQTYKPFWVGVGQIGIYIWALVAFSFYLRKQIGHKTWRAIHFLSFLSFAMSLIHGIFAGTDSGLPLVIGMNWFAGASLLFLTLYRILVSKRTVKAKPASLNQRP
jgi:predicted ferric reductase